MDLPINSMVIFHGCVNLPEGNNVKRTHYHSIGQLWTLSPHENQDFTRQLLVCITISKMTIEWALTGFILW